MELALLNIAIFQGVVIGAILLGSPFFKSKTNQYLAFAFFTLSWSLLNLVLDTTQAFEKYPSLKVVDILDSSLLFPVLIFFFVINQLDHPQKDARSLRWLFVPYCLSVVHSILDEIGSNTAFVMPDFFMTATNLLGILLALITLFFIPFILIKTYRHIQSSANSKEKRWLIYIWLFELFFLMTWLSVLLVGVFVEGESPHLMNMLALYSTLIIHWIGYTGVYKLRLANDQKKIKALLLNRRTETKKAEPEAPASTQDVAEENSYFKELERLCSDQKIYRDNSLDRNKVADMLGISPSYLSQLVNSITGDNFSTYINRYRVEEVKALILDKEFDNYSLLSIGLECGFSSKTTFFNWFKKITGMTPNTYRKVHQ